MESNVPKAQSLKEFHERRKACWDFDVLADGEQKIVILPAFDLRDTADKTYGQHGVEIVFVKRKGNKAVNTSFYTGLSVDHQVTVDVDHIDNKFMGGGQFATGRNISFMCTGLYTHTRYKKDTDYPEYAHHSECNFVPGGKCYGEAGSALYGEVLLDTLINFGEKGVWDEIDKELNRGKYDD